MIRVRLLHQDKWQPYLHPGEVVLWDGQPVPYRILRWSDLLTIPFALIFLLIALAFESDAVQRQAPQIFLFGGMVVILLSLYGVAGRLAMRFVARSETYYAVTNKRVLVLTQLWEERMISLPVERIPHIEQRYHRDGTGTILLGRNSEGVLIGFEDIRYAGAVAQQIQQLRKIYTPYSA